MPSKPATFKITLPLPDKSLHAHNKGHWRGKSASVREARLHAALQARSQSPVPMGTAVVSYDIYYPDLRNRDVTNTVQGLKASIDGIVDAGVIPDDNWKVLSVGHIRGHLDRGNPRVELVFTEESDSNG